MSSREVIRIFDMQDVAQLVKLRRKELGLSQSELGVRTNTSRSLIQDLERGKETVQANKVFSLLAHLGVKIDFSYFKEH